MPGLSAGDLDYVFVLQRPTPGSLSPDDWTDIDTEVWASIKALRASEQMRYGVPNAQGQSVITIRFREDVRASYRLIERDVSPARSFEILGYSDPDGGREQLDLLVVEQL